MTHRTFINLPVRNLDKSMDFFQSIGFEFNDQFTDNKAGCMIISETLSVMLLTKSYFRTFTKKTISDAKTATEVLISLETSSKEEVMQKISKAQSLGAEIYAKPQDHGWIYQHSFADPDGHQWEFSWVDESQLPE